MLTNTEKNLLIFTAYVVLATCGFYLYQQIPVAYEAHKYQETAKIASEMAKCMELKKAGKTCDN